MLVLPNLKPEKQLFFKRQRCSLGVKFSILLWPTFLTAIISSYSNNTLNKQQQQCEIGRIIAAEVILKTGAAAYFQPQQLQQLNLQQQLLFCDLSLRFLAILRDQETHFTVQQLFCLFSCSSSSS